MFKRYRKFIYFVIVFIFLILFMYWQNNTLQVSRYLFEYDKLPEAFNGYKIVQISDMHGKYFGNNNSTLARRIKLLNPDILFATGDMMSSTKNDGGAFLDFLDEFNRACPVYMCLGNHEQIARMINGNDEANVYYRDFIEKAKKRGVILLDNEKVTLSKGIDTIHLSGLSLELYHYSRRDRGYYDESLFLTKYYIESAIGKPEPGFNILLAHNPAYFDEYVSWGADLILSGHVHGGIIQIPFKGGLLSPEHVFFPEYDAGLFESNASKMIVNRGLGYSVFNFRIFNRPEITYIELVK